MSLRFDFLIDFDAKMIPKREPSQILFLERLFYRCLKDVYNKIRTVEVEMNPKTDPNSN